VGVPGVTAEPLTEGLRPRDGDQRAPGPPARELLVRCVLLCLAARVVLQVIATVAVERHGGAGLDRFSAVWSAWDAPHYLRLAEVGYQPAGTPGDDPFFVVFFPGYPAAVAVAHLLVPDLVVAGLTVSFAATVAACYLLHRLVCSQTDESTADRAVLLLLAFPTAFFLFAPYTESLFLVGALGAVHAARTSRWWLAAAAGAVGSGTRIVGVAIAPALAWDAVRQPATARQRMVRLVCSGLTATGLLIYLTINQMVYDDPFHFLDVQREHWFQERVWPWVPVRDAVNALQDGTTGDLKFIMISRLIAVVVILAVLLLGVRSLTVGDQVFAWIVFLVTMSASWLLSLPRYALAIYPLFIVAAQRTADRRALVPVLGLSTCLQAWLFYRYASGRFTY
jgi:hypothetical protein